MAVRKKSGLPKIKKYKSVQTATNARRVTGSKISRNASTSYAQSQRSRSKGQQGAGSLNDIIIRVINGVRTPISQGQKKKKQ
jgi:hypothetical protein